MGSVLEAGVPVPANVIEAGHNDISEYMEDEAGGLYPGWLVKKGTGDNQVVVATPGDVDILGIVGLNQYAERVTPGTGKTAIFTIGQMVSVIRTGYVVLTSDAAGANTTMGVPQRCITTNGFVEDAGLVAVGVAFNQAALQLNFDELWTQIGQPMTSALATEEFVCHLSKW